MKRLMIAALVLGAALAAYLPGTACADDDKLEVKINGRMPTVTVPTADGPVKIMRNQVKIQLFCDMHGHNRNLGAFFYD